MKVALKKTTCPGMPLWERVLARLIDRCTGRRGYFHAELLFDDGYSFTADPAKGVTIWRHAWTPGGWTFFDIGPRDEAHVRAWARRHCGEGYDFAGCLGCWLPWVRHWRAHLYCSLAVARALRFRRKLQGLGGDEISPNKLDAVMRASGYPIVTP